MTRCDVAFKRNGLEGSVVYSLHPGCLKRVFRWFYSVQTACTLWIRWFVSAPGASYTKLISSCKDQEAGALVQRRYHFHIERFPSRGRTTIDVLLSLLWLCIGRHRDDPKLQVSSAYHAECGASVIGYDDTRTSNLPQLDVDWVGWELDPSDWPRHPMSLSSVFVFVHREDGREGEIPTSP